MADTHLGFDYPVKPRVERRRRGHDFFDNFKRILDYAVVEKVDLVVHGGDFFFRSKIPQLIVDKAYGMLYDFAESGIPTVIVPGNHERSELPISFLTSHPNIHIFDEPGAMMLNIAGNIVALCGFPFIRNNVRGNFPHLIQELAEGIDESDLKLLCLHQSVAGAKVVGYTFFYGPDVIQVEDIPDYFDAVLCGHIHRRQTLWKTSKTKSIPILYPGSIERTSFAERDEDKGFYVLHYHPEEDGLELGKIEEVNLPCRPMVEIVVSNMPPIPKELTDWFQEEISKISADSVVRIKCESNSVRKILTADFLRVTFPESMNVSIVNTR